MFRFGYMFRMLHCCISQTMNSALAEMDITSAQGHILGYLARCKEPPCPRDVEESFHLSHPTVSGLLARLEKKGFIELRPDAQDKRCKRIYILPKGVDSNGRMYRTIIDNETRIVQDFSEEEKEQFFAFLNRAAANMGCDPHFLCFNEEESDQ